MNERIKRIREYYKLTQDEFGKRIGSARNTIANYESGNRSPSNSVVLSICREFNINESWLRSGEGEMFKERSPSEEVGYYVEELLEYDGNGNPFYDMIIEMMKKYSELDDKSKTVIREYFRGVADGIHKEKQEG